MTYLKTFTKYIQEFIDKLCDCYSDDTDFLNFQTYIIILKKTNPRKIFEIFNIHCTKYTEQIKNKDEQFLLTTDFTKDNIEIDTIVNDKNAFNIIQKLRNYWIKMDTDMKDSIWSYLNLFLVLSDKIKDTNS